jgi:hypothetical protein
MSSRNSCHASYDLLVAPEPGCWNCRDAGRNCPAFLCVCYTPNGDVTAFGNVSPGSAGSADSSGHAMGANPNPGSSTLTGRSPHKRHDGTNCPVVVSPEMGVLRTLKVVATTGPLHFLQT